MILPGLFAVCAHWRRRRHPVWWLRPGPLRCRHGVFSGRAPVRSADVWKRALLHNAGGVTRQEWTQPRDRASGDFPPVNLFMTRRASN